MNSTIAPTFSRGCHGRTTTWTLVRSLLTLATGLAFAQETPVTIEARSAARTGSWMEADGMPKELGRTYHWCMSAADRTPTATARLDLSKVKPGKYDLEMLYRGGRNRAPAAPWIISGRNGIWTNLVDMRQPTNILWVSLAKGIELDASDQSYVLLQNSVGELGQVLPTASLRLTPSQAATPFVAATTVTLPDGTTTAPPAAASPAPTPAPGPNDGLLVEVILKGPGRVLRSPNQLRFDPGTKVTLTAQADSAYVFAGWAGPTITRSNTYHNPLTLVLKSNMVLEVSFLNQAAGAIVDHRQATLEGSWTYSPAAWGGAWIDGYHFCSTASDTSSSAIYRPSLPKAGRYDVYVWYVQGANRTKYALWDIVSGRDKKQAVVNQQVNGSQWNLIAAAMPFDQGTNGYARVGLPNPLPEKEPVGTSIVCDSVAFVFVGQ